MQVQIITITPDELNNMIQQAAFVSSEATMLKLENKLAEQKIYYEELLDAKTIAGELKCSLDSVYRYWREGNLKHGQIKPSEKGSTRANIDEFRRNLNRKSE